jgi:galactokinase
MTGGGFGGAAVALVRADSAERVREKIQSAYAEEFGFEPWIFLTRAASGARAWKLSSMEK